MTRVYLDNIPRHMTLKQCADELGIAPERVRQIEKEALAKLEKLLNERGVKKDGIVPDDFTWMRA